MSNLEEYLYYNTSLTGVRVEGLGWVMSNLKEDYNTSLTGVRVEGSGWVMSNLKRRFIIQV